MKKNQGLQPKRKPNLNRIFCQQWIPTGYYQINNTVQTKTKMQLYKKAFVYQFLVMQQKAGQEQAEMKTG
jgi:hypothetical protein